MNILHEIEGKIITLDAYIKLYEFGEKKEKNIIEIYDTIKILNNLIFGSKKPDAGWLQVLITQGRHFDSISVLEKIEFHLICLNSLIDLFRSNPSEENLSKLKYSFKLFKEVIWENKEN